ncbi:MAG TPA: hypothetical protein VFF07_10170 [Actinomycetota bacterium]|nr:hypothetical protein [Actinomycetota bacterium]
MCKKPRPSAGSAGYETADTYGGNEISKVELSRWRAGVDDLVFGDARHDFVRVPRYSPLGELLNDDLVEARTKRLNEGLLVRGVGDVDTVPEPLSPEPRLKHEHDLLQRSRTLVVRRNEEEDPSGRIAAPVARNQLVLMQNRSVRHRYRALVRIHPRDTRVEEGDVPLPEGLLKIYKKRLERAPERYVDGVGLEQKGYPIRDERDVALVVNAHP